MKNKLVICGSCLEGGGAERVLSVLSKPFADHFDEVFLVLWLDWRFPKRFYSIDDRVKIVGVGQSTGSHSIIRHMLWFRQFIKLQKPDIILSFFEMINLSVIISLIGIKSKIVVSERNDPYFFQHGKTLRNIINIAYRNTSVKRIIMQTQHNKDYFIKSSIYNKVEVVFNPININKEIIGSSVISPKKNIVLSAARLEHQKKQDILISAFALFHKKHPDYKLYIFGNGSCRDSLTDFSNRTGVSDFVLMPGATKELWKEMQSAKMFVMTSEYEGMSNSLIEAMSIGLPCISTEVSGATDLIKSGTNGYLAKQGAVEEIANYMSMIADNEKMAEDMGKEASKVYSLLNIDKISKEWLSLFDSVINVDDL